MNTIQKNKINEVIDDITVVIVMYQETKEIIFKTLEKIKDFKIIIVDNNNDKILKQKIMSQFQIENYLLNKKNKGFSFAANQAIKLSKTTYNAIESRLYRKRKYLIIKTKDLKFIKMLQLLLQDQ